MIRGIGTDIVDLSRIRRLLDRFGEAFENKCFTEKERNKARQSADPAASYAKRFAAKEAVLKTIGTGMRQGLGWHDISIENDQLGKPVVHLSGGVADYIRESLNIETGFRFHISLSDEGDLALAFSVLEMIDH